MHRFHLADFHRRSPALRRLVESAYAELHSRVKKFSTLVRFAAKRPLRLDYCGSLLLCVGKTLELESQKPVKLYTAGMMFGG